MAALHIDGVYQGNAYGPLLGSGSFISMNAQSPGGVQATGYHLDELVMHLGVWTTDQIQFYASGAF